MQPINKPNRPTPFTNPYKRPHDPHQDDFGQIPTNIVLVPSLLDGHHEFVFPQPPFGDRDHVKSQFFAEELGTLPPSHSPSLSLPR